MKPTKFFACALAVIAIAGCNSKQGDAATNGARQDRAGDAAEGRRLERGGEPRPPAGS